MDDEAIPAAPLEEWPLEAWPIESERLSLIPLTAPFLEACLSGNLAAASAIVGLKIPEDWEVKASTFQMRLEQLRADESLQPWLLRAIALRDEGLMVGYIGFHGAPGDEALREYTPNGLEIGYTVLPDYRKQGYATEACETLMRWACKVHEITDFIVSISPDNEASLHIAKKLEFEKVGSHIDEEDGPEDVFLRRYKC